MKTAVLRHQPINSIAFYLHDGVEVLDFAGPLEVFSFAGYQIFTITRTGKAIKSQGVLTITPDYSIGNAPDADMLAFFGGHSTGAIQYPEVIQWVRQQRKHTRYFSVCTGAFFLAEAGLLHGKVATTFHESINYFANRYPEIDVRKDVRYVDNGNIVTTAGVSAGIDGALHLVEKFQGSKAARDVARFMEYEHWQSGKGLVIPS